MSNVRNLLCVRTMLNSRQLSSIVRRQLVTTTNCQQSLELNNHNNNHSNLSVKRLLLSDSKINNYIKNKNIGRSRYTTALSNMTKDQANELVFRLNDSERKILLQVLNQFESNKERKTTLEDLAAVIWRSRFGRPIKMRLLGDVAPTGSYYLIPDWLKYQMKSKNEKKKYTPVSVLMVMGNRTASNDTDNLIESTPQPSTNDLMKLVVINSLPFIGFGFLDNFTMIIAGDYIEHSIGCVITISTMAAAALGNTISDVLGIGSAYYVERIAEKVGIRAPDLTPIQLEMSSCRRASNIGRILGITIGCLLGMCPLLFINSDEKAEKPTDVSVSASPEEEAIKINVEKT
uniref:CSON005009 protein n=1 Tax=Culicoides sonorensis TaxID=179676 RepID=A0A336MQU0_CULSO